MQRKLSIIVHTRNEEHNIRSCLESCELLEAEVIVADMESSDRTIELARSLGAHVIKLHLLEEFDASRNISAEIASGEWILFLDADERLTPAIAETISALLDENDPNVAGYALPFKVISFGKWIQHAGNWWPSYKSPPLLLRGRFRFPGPVHVPARVDGRVVRIQPRNDDDAILHFSHPNLTHYFDKLNRYTSLEKLKNDHKDPIAWQEVATSFGKTFAWYFDTTGGKRDEIAGFFLSFGSAVYEAVSRLKSAEIKGLTDLPQSAAEFLSLAAEGAASEAAAEPPWATRLVELLDSGLAQSTLETSSARKSEFVGSGVVISSSADQSRELGSATKLFGAGRKEPYQLRFAGVHSAPSLRVAMVTHRNALEILGGGEVQLFQTARHLRDIGVHCDVFVGRRPEDVGEYDILHYFSLHHDHQPDRSRPTILTPITIDRHELVTVANQIPQLFRVDNDSSEIEAGYAYLRCLTSQRKRNADTTKIFGNATILDAVDHVAVNCDVEADVVKLLTESQSGRISVIPNGIDSTFANWSPEPDSANGQPFVLCVGRVEPNKNQLSLIWALRNLDIDLLLVGTFSSDEYARACRRIAGERVKFLGPQSSAVVRDWMTKAACHVLASFGETPGLANLEAAVLRCPIVVSDRGGEREYFADFAEYCDPLDPESILSAVDRARAMDGERLDSLRSKILNEYSWEHAAVAVRDLYLKVIEDWKAKNQND